jgi:uncharacterized protein (DUF302 family)
LARDPLMEPSMPARGLITVRSDFGPEVTMNRLEAELSAKGMTVFARVDHAAGAEAAGLSLQPTELIVFGHARGGTPLMQAVRTIGVDLPVRMLVWEDASRDTWLTYNDPRWLATRHGLGRDAAAAVNALASTLRALVTAATAASAAPAGPRANGKSDPEP